MCGFTLISLNLPENQASFSRSYDDTGRCQYTFTVTSPDESSYPGASGKPESLLTLLEALVSRLVGEDGYTQVNRDVRLQETYSQVTGKREPAATGPGASQQTDPGASEKTVQVEPGGGEPKGETMPAGTQHRGDSGGKTDTDLTLVRIKFVFPFFFFLAAILNNDTTR